jgi:2-polyprenyl-3-methyl-5-hydroxy-6-metoxy-1,4-benzoquinol methylase
VIRPSTLYWFVREELFRHEVYRVKIRPGDRVIDGGAEIGLFSRYCHEKGAEGVAVEFHKHRWGKGASRHPPTLKHVGFRVNYVKEYQLSGYLHVYRGRAF